MPRIPPELIPSQSRDNPGDPLAVLAQAENFAELDKLGTGEWTILYEYEDTDAGSRCSYSALLSAEHVSVALNNTSWELHIGEGAPGFSQSNLTGEPVTTYERFGLDGIEPILYVRHFHDLKPRQFDVSEEFRLFHNLYYDHPNNRYIFVDEGGDDTVVLEVTPQRVRVRTRFLRQYMAARQLYLVIFFDHRADAQVDLATAEAALPVKRVATSDRCYSFNVGDVSCSTCSRLVGKRLIAPPSIEECGVWPFEPHSDQYANFIVACDEDGKDIVHSCDPDALANYFGANEQAPHFLTPIWFTRNVLSKYYDELDRYSVEDG
jgi:hypothetical protein